MTKSPILSILSDIETSVGRIDVKTDHQLKMLGIILKRTNHSLDEQRDILQQKLRKLDERSF